MEATYHRYYLMAAIKMFQVLHKNSFEKHSRQGCKPEKELNT